MQIFATFREAVEVLAKDGYRGGEVQRMFITGKIAILDQTPPRPVTKSTHGNRGKSRYHKRITNGD